MKRVLAVGGGKGGVGKSLIAANLAIAMAQLDKRVILVDADLGGANLHTIFGIDRPKCLLEKFINREVEKLDDVLTPTQQDGLKLICGGMPVLGTANPNFAQKQRLIKKILDLDTEIIIVDVGAGVGFNVLDLYNAADLRLLVFTPELTSLHNGYGFLKSAILRDIQRGITAEAREFLTASGPEIGGESLAAVLSRLAKHSAKEAEKAAEILQNISIFIIGNMIRTEKEDHVLSAISNMIKDHLKIEAPVAGLIRYGEKILRSVNDRRPFMLWAGVEGNAEAFRNLADRFVKVKIKRQGALQPDMKPLPIPMTASESYERSDPRYDINWRAVLKKDGVDHIGRLFNLAFGGAMVVFNQKINPSINGDKALLVIGPTDEGESIALHVEERHRDESGTRLGFAFYISEEKERESLARLVAKAQAATAMSDMVS